MPVPATIASEFFVLQFAACKPKRLKTYISEKLKLGIITLNQTKLIVALAGMD
jgi:hypothetical protein